MEMKRNNINYQGVTWLLFTNVLYMYTLCWYGVSLSLYFIYFIENPFFIASFTIQSTYIYRLYDNNNWVALS